MSNVFLSHPPSYFLRQSLSMNVELGCLLHELLRTSFFCFPSAGVVGTPEFDVGVGSQLMLIQQTFPPTEYLPSPMAVFLLLLVVVMVFGLLFFSFF